MKKKKLQKGPFIVDHKHDFIPVVCEKKKSNGFFCNTWLGEIETSRPNISKHRCRDCKTTYRHIVSVDGSVRCEETNDVVVSTKLSAKVIECPTTTSDR